MTVLLLGDSSVARLFNDHPDVAERAFGSDVECRAVDGSWSGSLRSQVGDRPLDAYACVVLAIGSSDCHPAAKSSLALFEENLRRELVKTRRWVALLPSGLKRVYEPFDVDAVNVEIQQYAELLSDLVTDAGGLAVDTRAVALSLGDSAYAEDDMHLSRAAFQELAPRIAQALASVG